MCFSKNLDFFLNMEFIGRVQKGSNPMLDTCDLKRSL
jgi:hypothetical protein